MLWAAKAANTASWGAPRANPAIKGTMKTTAPRRAKSAPRAASARTARVWRRENREMFMKRTGRFGAPDDRDSQGRYTRANGL